MNAHQLQARARRKEGCVSALPSKVYAYRTHPLPLWKAKILPRWQAKRIEWQPYGAAVKLVVIPSVLKLLANTTTHIYLYVIGANGDVTLIEDTFQGKNRMSLRIDTPELTAPVVESTLIWERVMK